MHTCFCFWAFDSVAFVCLSFHAAIPLYLNHHTFIMSSYSIEQVFPNSSCTFIAVLKSARQVSPMHTHAEIILWCFYWVCIESLNLGEIFAIVNLPFHEHNLYLYYKLIFIILNTVLLHCCLEFFKTVLKD